MAKKRTPIRLVPGSEESGAGDEDTAEALALRAEELAAREEELQRKAASLEDRAQTLHDLQDEVATSRRKLLEARTKAIAELEERERQLEDAETIEVQLNALKLLYERTKRAVAERHEAFEDELSALERNRLEERDLHTEQVRELRKSLDANRETRAQLQRIVAHNTHRLGVLQSELLRWGVERERQRGTPDASPPTVQETESRLQQVGDPPVAPGDLSPKAAIKEPAPEPAPALEPVPESSPAKPAEPDPTPWQVNSLSEPDPHSDPVPQQPAPELTLPAPPEPKPNPSSAEQPPQETEPEFDGMETAILKGRGGNFQVTTDTGIIPRFNNQLPFDQRETSAMRLSVWMRIKLWYYSHVSPAVISPRRRAIFIVLLSAAAIAALAWAGIKTGVIRIKTPVEAAMAEVPLSKLDSDATARLRDTGPRDSILSLSREQIVDGVRRNSKAALRTCWSDAVAAGLLAPGEHTYLLAWTITPEGAATAARVDQPTSLHPKVRTCMTAGLERWTFPKATNPSVVRNFPLGPIMAK